MKTRQDLITATLELLNVLAAGQAPEPEDVLAIDKLINGKIAELNELDIYWSADTSEFEDQYIDPLATILADMAAPSFGQPRNAESRADAIFRIRGMKPSTYVPGSVMTAEYF